MVSGRMPAVTCPRCHTRQSIAADVAGYTCERCGTAWVFATCENCGERFHMPPGTVTWTCPNCGFEHAPPALEHAAPAHAAPMPPSRSSASLRARRLRLGSIALIGIVAVLVGSFLLSRGGSGATTQSPDAQAVATLCLHLRDLQTARVDALTRVAEAISGDADAIEAAGNQQLADAVRTLRQAVIGYRDALQTQNGDDTAAAAAMADALSNPTIPC
jgi:ribosomal protein L37AE/L43A